MMTSILRSSVALVLSVAALDGARAEDPAPPTAVVVSASRVEQTLRDAIAHTTVINESEIRNSSASDLPSLLRGVAGLELSQSGGLGSAGAQFMRAGEGRQTLVMIDGVRVTDAAFGTTAIEHIMLDQVERIEIVRGNVSALYGSAAVGGVIQIFTRGGQHPPRAQFDLAIGSNRLLRGSVSYGGTVEANRFSIAASGLRTDGFNATDPNQAPAANPDRDGYVNTSLSAMFSRRLSAGDEVGVRLFRSNGRADYDNPFAPRVDEFNRIDTRLSSLSLFANNQISPLWTSRLTLADASQNARAVTTDSPDANFDSTNQQLTWQNLLTLSKDQLITLGFEQQRQKVTSDGGFARDARNVSSPSIAYNGRFAAHQFQLAWRRDHFSDFGSANTRLIGYGYEFADGFKFTALSSTAFNAPTFNQLYFPNFGNPDLKPERARSFEAGLQYSNAAWLAKLVWFRTRYTDLIDSLPPNFTPINIARARVKGTELSVSGAWLGWSLRANLTLQDPVNEDTGEVPRRRARGFGSVQLSRDTGAWMFGAQLIRSGGRNDRHVLTDEALILPGYTVLNGFGRYALDKQWSLIGRIDNALDSSYQLAHGYRTGGRLLMLGLSWRQQ